MAPLQQIPPAPIGVPLKDDKTGLVALQWQAWYIAVQNAIKASGAVFAPIDAEYWASTSDPTLTNERNIGLLATGYLKIVTAIGIATPATVTAIPAADIAPGTAPIDISGNAATATSAGSTSGNAATATALQTARTINGVSFNGTANIVVAAAAATLTGTTLPALIASALTALNASELASGTVPQARKWAAATITLTGSNNDVNFSSADMLRCNNSGGALTITGLLAGVAGQVLDLWAVAANTVTINHQDAASTAANRIITPTGAPVVVTASVGAAQLQYDATTARWRLFVST